MLYWVDGEIGEPEIRRKGYMRSGKVTAWDEVTGFKYC